MTPDGMKLRSVIELGQRLEPSADVASLAAALADGARGMVPFGACAICLKAGEGWRVWRAPAGRPQALTVTTGIPEEAVAILDRFLQLDQPLVIDDLLAPPWNAAGHREILWKDGTRAALLLPLVAAARPFGVLAFTAFQPDVYQQVDLAFVRFVAWLVALVARVLPENNKEEKGTTASEE